MYKSVAGRMGDAAETDDGDEAWYNGAQRGDYLCLARNIIKGVALDGNGAAQQRSLQLTAPDGDAAAAA